jgi:carbamoyl-phosphate synthase large subunit
LNDKERYSKIERMLQKPSVLVTAVGGRSVGYQILDGLQQHRNKYRIVATDMDPFAPGLYESDAAYLLPGANEKDYIPELLRIAKKEKVKIILFGSEAEVKAVAKHKQIFLDAGIIPVVSDETVVENSFDKQKLARFLQEKNILTPSTKLLRSAKDAEELQFPIVIKPTKNSTGSRNCFIVKDINELEVLLKDLQKENIEMIAQEYVGSEDEEYTVGIVIRPDGVVVDTIVMRRKLIGMSRGLERKIGRTNYVLSTGYSQGFFVDQPDVKAYCEKVAKAVGAIGPLNIQCRRGKKGVYIFEVHPRFSGSGSQRAAVGFNEPDAIIRTFLNKEKITRIPHKLGYAVIRKFANTVVSMSKYEKMKNK